MSKKKEKKMPDERIRKENEAFTAKMFWVILPLLIVSLAVKLICDVPWYVYVLEPLCLVASGIYALVQELRNGILFVGKKDAALTEIQNGILTKAFMIAFHGIVYGAFLLMFVFVFLAEKYFFWILSYLLIFMIPGMAITVKGVKNGWTVWGTKKKEQVGKKRLGIASALGGLFFGIVMEAVSGFSHVYHDGAFHATGLLFIVLQGAAFGGLYFIGMKVAIKRSEENADAIVEASTAEDCAEEAAHEE